MRYGAAAGRRLELQRLVQHQGYVSSRQAAEQLQVSDMTIRRDLDQLAGQGLVLRVVGGARRPTGPPFAERAASGADAKEQIARACGRLFAEGLLTAGMVVALDAGTTVERLAALLPGGVTVVTHSVPVMAACADREDLSLIGLGGSYHPATRSLGGPETRAQLANLHIDLAVVSASALQARGLFCHDAIEADTKRSMLTVAARRLLVADSAKFTSRAPIRIAGWESVDALVTDDALPPQARDDLAGWGVEVHVGVAAPPG
jgi:DeoR family fructose operon transcriptional repressor